MSGKEPWNAVVLIHMVEGHNTELIILQCANESIEQEMVDDLVTIVTSFFRIYQMIMREEKSEQHLVRDITSCLQ